MIAHEDPELLPWLMGIMNGRPTRAGDFLRSLAGAALRADFQNYREIRPALLNIRDRYPQYDDPDPIADVRKA